MKGHLLLILGLLVATGVLYGRTFDDEWHLDDRAELHWPGVREFSPDVRAAHYRGIVTLLTWSMNYRIDGERPIGYHVFNTGVHAMNAALVYALAWLFATGSGRRISSRRRFVAVTAALLFCVHPLATQSVTYVTQRSTSLATLFLLSALVAYLRARFTPGSTRLIWLVVAGAAYAAGLHTKHTVLVLPFLLMAIEWSLPPADRRAAGTRVLAIAAIAVLTVWRLLDFAPRILPAESGPAAAESAARATVPPFDRTTYFLNQGPVIARYLSLAVFPFRQNLYHDPVVHRSLLDPAVLLSFPLLALLAVLAFRMQRRQPLLSLGLSFFFVTLVPTSSIVPSDDLMFEHRMYAPLVGLALSAASSAWAAGDRLRVSPRKRYAAVGAIGLALAVATYARNGIWATELTLWKDVVAKSPGYARARVNLGLALQTAGRLDEAEAQYERVLEIDPSNTFAMNNLGNIDESRGRSGAARRRYESALRTDSTYADAWLNLGNLQLEEGDAPAAEESYRRSIRFAARFVPGRYNLAKALEAQGRYEEAVDAYESALVDDAGNAEILNDLGCAQLQLGLLESAESRLREATAARPDWSVPYFNLGLVCRARGDSTAATAAFRAAAERTPRLDAAFDLLRETDRRPEDVDETP